ncbi:hypothetical protein RRG08_034622 [Elysia crispata]|uniref:Uncharacterized protein n=1 Tax=Elysia crispata TaxID=231223 RepID=A0AAE1E8N4_9GAST|nr:hypothetical protein RRG08_034622 [Elysia crispata]
MEFKLNDVLRWNLDDGETGRIGISSDVSGSEFLSCDDLTPLSHFAGRVSHRKQETWPLKPLFPAKRKIPFEYLVNRIRSARSNGNVIVWSDFLR